MCASDLCCVDVVSSNSSVPRLKYNGTHSQMFMVIKGRSPLTQWLFDGVSEEFFFSVLLY